MMHRSCSNTHCPHPLPLSHPAGTRQADEGSFGRRDHAGGRRTGGLGRLCGGRGGRHRARTIGRCPRQPSLLGRLGVNRGICVITGDRQCKLARALAEGSELIVFVQLARDEDVQAAARAADAAGLYGRRIFVAKSPHPLPLSRKERGEDPHPPGTVGHRCAALVGMVVSRKERGEDPHPLPLSQRERGEGAIGLADNVADAAIVLDDPQDAPPKAEVLRVLRPGGKALVGDDLWEKPVPQGMDDWSHHYHGPDNNPQSRDKLARAPLLMQFIAEPRFAPGPQSVVAAAGRVFMALGHVAWHQREEPVVNTLIAINGLNGTLLWKYPLKPGIMVDRSTMIATPATLYLADDTSCKLLDAASGKLQDEIVIPASLAGGTFWKWMALDHGVLYALIGPAEPADPKTNWKRTEHGWPWQEISQGYNNDRQYPWGFARTLLAIDPKTKKVLWRHDEDPAIDSRSLCMSNGRMYFGHFGRYLTCLEAAGGTLVWRRTIEKDPALFKAIGPYRPGQGFVEGWRSTVYLKCTDKALYFVGPQIPWISALSADDGHYLWKDPVKNAHIVIRDDGLYTIGAQFTKVDTKKLDPLSGTVLATYATCRRACTRSTGSRRRHLLPQRRRLRAAGHRQRRHAVDLAHAPLLPYRRGHRQRSSVLGPLGLRLQSAIDGLDLLRAGGRFRFSSQSPRRGPPGGWRPSPLSFRERGRG